METLYQKRIRELEDRLSKTERDLVTATELFNKNPRDFFTMIADTWEKDPEWTGIEAALALGNRINWKSSIRSIKEPLTSIFSMAAYEGEAKLNAVCSISPFILDVIGLDGAFHTLMDVNIADVWIEKGENRAEWIANKFGRGLDPDFWYDAVQDIEWSAWRDAHAAAAKDRNLLPSEQRLRLGIDNGMAITETFGPVGWACSGYWREYGVSTEPQVDKFKIGLDILVDESLNGSESVRKKSLKVWKELLSTITDGTMNEECSLLLCDAYIKSGHPMDMIVPFAFPIEGKSFPCRLPFPELLLASPYDSLIRNGLHLGATNEGFSTDVQHEMGDAMKLNPPEQLLRHLEGCSLRISSVMSNLTAPTLKMKRI